VYVQLPCAQVLPFVRQRDTATFALLPWFCALTLLLQPSKSKGTLAQLNFCLFCIFFILI
jgi:hypothetical protein